MKLLDRLKVINIGLSCFAEDLHDQNAEVFQVHWSPPAGGDQELIDILRLLYEKSETSSGISPLSSQ